MSWILVKILLIEGKTLKLAAKNTENIFIKSLNGVFLKLKIINKEKIPETNTSSKINLGKFWKKFTFLDMIACKKLWFWNF